MNQQTIIPGKKILLLFLSLTISFTAFAQISQGGLPYSLKSSNLKSKAILPTYSSKIQNVDALLAEDELNPTPYRYSKFEDVDIDMKKSGAMTELKEQNGNIWNYIIESENAKSIQVYFSEYRLPAGAKLFLYNEDYSIILGAFTNYNNDSDQALMIGDFEGSKVILEYFEPSDAEFEGKLKIGAIGQAYKSFKKSSSEDEDGYINVNCSEGATWQNEKHSVCRFSFRVGTSGYLCSGALINNINNDGTPYFLTANHCLESQSAAESVIAYFNYELIGCDGQQKQNLSLEGATLLATGAESDFTLLLFDNIPPAEYQPYYAGWDVTGDSGTMAIGIHHPEGFVKKISIDDSSAVNHPFVIGWAGGGETPPDSHWRVEFDRGVTNTGSSGSPLFNQEGRILGQLHGGSEFIDFYGKLNYSWNADSDTDTTLKYYLSPKTSDVLVMDGYYPAQNLPDPLFVPEFKQVCDSAAVELYAYSAFDPVSWEWSFLPDDVTFLEGTDAQSRNPVVEFNVKGEYDVTLSATNGAGSNEISYAKSILSGAIINVGVESIGLTNNCLDNFDSLIVSASGAKEYEWLLVEGSDTYFQIVNDTVNPIVIKLIEAIDSNVTLSLIVTGSHGKCSDEATFSQEFLKQNNDMVEDAIEVNLGINGPYSNYCASVEENEPVPPYDDCTGQLSWCDEYGTGENIVENSVWFYFIADSTGNYSLSSVGMDNQVAVYEAETIDDLFFTEDSIPIGANDDFTTKDFNPFITSISMTKGNKYWIQVDGSAGGAFGEFSLELKMLEPEFVENSLTEEFIQIYPQPAEEKVTIEWSPSIEAYESLSVYNMTGARIYEKPLDKSMENKVVIDIASWNSGIYFIKLGKKGEYKTAKLIK